MTMSLAQGLTSLNTKQPKRKKRTKAQQEKLIQDHRAYNKRMKQSNNRDLMMSLEDYDLYLRGLYKPKTSSTRKKVYTPPKQYCRETKHIPSLNSAGGIASKKESPKYTGTLVTGIATMHKSNAVPIINKEQAIEIAQMRRN